MNCEKLIERTAGSVRSDILVHWTGRDIERDDTSAGDKRRERHVERLRDILVDGLWMNRCKEELWTASLSGDGSLENLAKLFDEAVPSMQPSRVSRRGTQWPVMTCFTEIRLSQSEAHTARYGKLGIGVQRCFVLERGGGPVFYVRNNPQELAVEKALSLLEKIKALSKVPESEKIAMSEMLLYLLGYFKGMSGHGPPLDDFEFLEELEWRIVAPADIDDVPWLVGRIVDSDDDSDDPRPVCRLPLVRKDLAVLVFPDDETKALALEDAKIKSYLSTDGEMPPLLTVEICSHF